jgi:hypothetical protein
MMYRYDALAGELVARVRNELRDDHGNTLHVQTSASPAPCRSCLRIAPASSRLILFAYRPFVMGGPYAEVGPVFVHAEWCEPYRANAFPEDFRARTLVFRAYDACGAIRDAVLADGVDAEDALGRLFADDAVRFVHVRNPAWGCFDFAVFRGE